MDFSAAAGPAGFAAARSGSTTAAANAAPVWKTIDGRAREGLLHRTGHGARHALAQRGDIGGCLNEALGDHRLHSGSGKRLLAHQHLVENATERVEIGASINGLAGGLLRAHVRRGADADARVREGPALDVRQGLADAEIGDERVTILEHDVLGLHVAVHHAVSMRIVQRAGHLTRDSHCFVYGKLQCLVEAVAERVPLDVGHDIEQGAVRVAGVEERQDVRVTEPGRQLDLAKKALGADGLSDIGAKHLECHVSVVLEIAREVHSRHAALTELLLDSVAAFERDVEAFGGGRHAPVTSSP